MIAQPLELVPCKACILSMLSFTFGRVAHIVGRGFRQPQHQQQPHCLWGAHAVAALHKVCSAPGDVGEMGVKQTACSYACLGLHSHQLASA